MGTTKAAGMRDFDEALADIFEERAREFGTGARELLEALFQRGKLAGRELERQEQRHLSLEKAVRSECGNYLCVPVPKGMLVLEGTKAGADRVRDELLRHQRPFRVRDDVDPLTEMRAAMDEEILKKLTHQSRSLEQYRDVGMIFSSSMPRVPARQRANSHDWEETLFGITNTTLPKRGG